MTERKFPPILFVYTDAFKNTRVLRSNDSGMTQDAVDIIFKDFIDREVSRNEYGILLKNIQSVDLNKYANPNDSFLLGIEELAEDILLRKFIRAIRELHSSLCKVHPNVLDVYTERRGVIILADDMKALSGFLGDQNTKNSAAWIRNRVRHPICVLGTNETKQMDEMVSHEFGHFAQYLEQPLLYDDSRVGAILTKFDLLYAILATDLIMPVSQVTKRLIKALFCHKEYDLTRDFNIEGYAHATEYVSEMLDRLETIGEDPQDFSGNDLFARYHFEVNVAATQIRAPLIKYGINSAKSISIPSFALEMIVRQNPNLYPILTAVSQVNTIDGSRLNADSKELISNYLSDLDSFLQQLDKVKSSMNFRKIFGESRQRRLEELTDKFIEKWADRGNELRDAVTKWLNESAKVHRLGKLGIVEDKGSGMALG